MEEKKPYLPAKTGEIRTAVNDTYGIKSLLSLNSPKRTTESKDLSLTAFNLPQRTLSLISSEYVEIVNDSFDRFSNSLHSRFNTLDQVIDHRMDDFGHRMDDFGHRMDDLKREIAEFNSQIVEILSVIPSENHLKHKKNKKKSKKKSKQGSQLPRPNALPKDSLSPNQQPNPPAEAETVVPRQQQYKWGPEGSVAGHELYKKIPVLQPFSTAAALVTEWSVSSGLKLCIEDMDRLVGPRWRGTKNATYTRKKAVIKFIDSCLTNVHCKGLTRTQIAGLLDDFLLRRSHTLYQFCYNKKYKESARDEIVSIMEARS